ncbi:MAG TPA: radical SAM family heme chaperone HemW [Cyclobacteriaceae bacterium]|nr:radical SAM family heme chaperone HemW [Cyclobacteriaceae bacterium]
MAGLYLHIPFCKQACYYCDFHFSTNQSQKTELVEQIAHELFLQRDYLQGEPIETIYFGGGTPSLLTVKELDTLFTAIHKNYQVVENPEITLEANPDDLSLTKLEEIQSAGINRLSIGIQSFDEAVLRFLNRAHTAQEAFLCLDLARMAGISNLSIDLIYSIPGQDDELLGKNLEMAIKLKPTHLSAYSLTLEEKTVFGRWASHGKLTAMEENLSAAQFEIVMDTLIQHGYHHYEISNFCIPGYESKHNTSYWQQKKYLGVGPSAHSFDGDSRQFNISNNPLYIKALHENRIPFEREVLTRENKINEYLFTSLRTDRGCSLSYLSTQLEYDLMKKNEPYLDQLLKGKLIEITHDTLVLTRSGKLVADRIASDLFATE